MCMCKLYLGSLLYTAHLVNGMAVVAVDLWLQQGKRWVLVMSKQQRFEGYTCSEQKVSSLGNTTHQQHNYISFLYSFIVCIQLESIPTGHSQHACMAPQNKEYQSPTASWVDCEYKPNGSGSLTLMAFNEWYLLVGQGITISRYITLLWTCFQQFISPLGNSLCYVSFNCCHSKQWWQSLASLATCMSVVEECLLQHKNNFKGKGTSNYGT